MTDVAFHTGVPDPTGYACRLLRKAVRGGSRVLVTAPPARLAELDRQLWTFEEREFLPHLRTAGGRTSSALLALTPVWLAEAADLPEVPPVLVNLGAAMPEMPARFERVVEIVGSDDEERRGARGRWRAYAAGGHAIAHHPHPPGRT